MERAAGIVQAAAVVVGVGPITAACA
jgi:hypothetical protein